MTHDDHTAPFPALAAHLLGLATGAAMVIGLTPVVLAMLRALI
jgi:hypothetical protein